MLVALSWLGSILSAKMLITVTGLISNYLWRYAGALAIATVVAVFLSIRRLPGWLLALSATSWPISQGTVETVNVKTVSGQALGELGYSYHAEGERYSGYFLLQFANEQDAWDAIDPLKGQSIFIRYKRGNAAVSAVRSDDQNSFFAATHGNFIYRLLTVYVPELIGHPRRDASRL